MNFKIILIISLFFFIISIASVSAADLNNTYVNEISLEGDVSLVVDGDSSCGLDDGVDGDSSCEFYESDEIDVDSNVSKVDHSVATLKGDDFKNLQDEINNAPSGSVLELSKDYMGGYYDGITINKDLIIDGHYHILTCGISSNSGKITLRNLKIIDTFNNNAYCAIKIYNSAQYTLENCIFENNGGGTSGHGGAINNEAKLTLTIKNCEFNSNSVENYGGAIYSAGDVILEGCSFYKNKANTHGGAIYADGKVNVVDSYFYGNSAEGHGGAIYAEGEAYLENCQFELNYAGTILIDCYGGAIRSLKDVFANSCRFVKNHAADYGGAICAQNVYINIDQDPTKSFTSFFLNNDAEDDDGGAIYAYCEVKAVNTEFSNNNAKVDGGAVFASGNVNVNHCSFMTNKAYGAKGISCYGGAIRSKEDVTIVNCTYENNTAEDYGGAVYAKNVFVNTNPGNPDFFNSFFINNHADDNDGGAIYAEGDVSILNAVFSKNNAKVDGGAIFSKKNVKVKHSLFESNRADGASVSSCYGGAIYSKSDVNLNNCTFKKNYAENRGGAIYSSTMTMENAPSYFDGNTARDHGGAIYTDKFTNDIKYATFINNTAENKDGGAIYINGENWITFSDCVFLNNHCGDEGGAIYLDSRKSHLTLTNNVFSGNTAKKEGQTVFNCGYYDKIKNNFWAGKNPSSGNDQLIEWKSTIFQDNVHHSDSDPLNLKLNVNVDYMDDEPIIKAEVAFTRADGSIFYGELYDLDSLSLVAVPDMKVIIIDKTLNRLLKIYEPQNKGNYTITAKFYDIFTLMEEVTV